MSADEWLKTDARLDKIQRDLREISYRVELAKVADKAPLRQRQLLKEICWITAEYVVAK